MIASPTEAEGGLFSETNDNSVAILLTYGSARVLLAGDTEAREEEYMEQDGQQGGFQEIMNRGADAQNILSAERENRENNEGRGRSGIGAAYAACVLAFLHAAVSFYWAGGGTAGLSTIGGALEQLGRAREPALIAVLLAVGVLKALAGLLALSLVRPWGRAFPRRVLLAAAWGAAVMLTAYGGLFTLGGVFVMAGVIPASATADWTALRWHAFLWDPWFLLWGILLAAAALRFGRESSADRHTR